MSNRYSAYASQPDPDRDAREQELASQREEASYAASAGYDTPAAVPSAAETAAFARLMLRCRAIGPDGRMCRAAAIGGTREQPRCQAHNQPGPPIEYAPVATTTSGHGELTVVNLQPRMETIKPPAPDAPPPAEIKLTTHQLRAQLAGMRATAARRIAELLHHGTGQPTKADRDRAAKIEIYTAELARREATEHARPALSPAARAAVTAASQAATANDQDLAPIAAQIAAIAADPAHAGRPAAPQLTDAQQLASAAEDLVKRYGCGSTIDAVWDASRRLYTTSARPSAKRAEPEPGQPSKA